MADIRDYDSLKSEALIFGPAEMAEKEKEASSRYLLMSIGGLPFEQIR